MALTLINVSPAIDSFFDGTPFTITPTTPGTALVIAMAFDNAENVISSITSNAGDVFVPIAGTDSNDLGNTLPFSTNIWWCPVGIGGATQITINAGAFFNAWVYEYTGNAIQVAATGINADAPQIPGPGAGSAFSAVVLGQQAQFTLNGGPAHWAVSSLAIQETASPGVLQLAHVASFNWTGVSSATQYTAVNAPLVFDPPQTNTTFGYFFGFAAAHTNTPPPGCQLTVTPPTLTFSKDQCDPIPTTQNVQVTNTGNADVVPFTVAADQPWVTITPNAGNTPATIAIGVNPTGLAPGTYTATITFTSATCGIPTVVVTLLIGQVVVAACIPDPNADAEGVPTLNGVFSDFVASGQLINPVGFPVGTYQFASFTQAGPDVTAFGGDLFTTLCGRERVIMIVPDHYDDDGVGIDSQYEPWLTQDQPNVLRYGGFRCQLVGHGVIRMTPVTEEAANMYPPKEVLLNESTPISFEKGLRATEKFLSLIFSNKKVCGAFFIVQQLIMYANPIYGGSRSPKK